MGAFYLICMEELYSLFKKSLGVSTDTRNIKKGMMFFALKGENFDANNFVDNALQAGASVVVTQNKNYINKPNCYYCEDVLVTLQGLAAFHRTKLKCPIIAITGTNGKTTTKELTREALSCVGNVLATQGNLNNHIGVPLTLLSIDDSVDFAIVEMGANHPKEINFLCNIARPDFGLITNIGKAHLEGFGSYEGVVRTKCELYDFLFENKGVAFVNEDESILSEKSCSLNKISYSRQILSFTPISKQDSLYVSFSFTEGENKYLVNSNFCGEYNFPNFLSAIAVAKHFGADLKCVAKKLSDYVPSNNRSQVMRTSKNTLIVDAYNANPSSMRVALDSFHAADVKNKIVFLGDMRELGDDSILEHLKILEILQKYNFEKCFLVGSQFGASKENYPNFTYFQTIDEAVSALSIMNISDSFVLVKGSRGIKTEKIIDVL